MTGLGLMNYYFLAASLPSVSMGTEPHLTVPAFLALCREHLAPGDFEALERVLGNGSEEAGTAFERKWHNADVELRNAVAIERAVRTGADSSQFLREHSGLSVYIRKAVSDAMARKNPREREMALDRLRWSVVEEMQGFDPFSPSAILAYGLKLKIASRWAAMDSAAGAGRVEGISAQWTTQKAK